MGGSRLGQKHKHGDKENLQTGKGKPLVNAEPYQGQENCQGIPLSGCMEATKEVGKAQKPDRRSYKEKEASQQKEDRNSLIDIH
jgi:hypothetical protein